MACYIQAFLPWVACLRYAEVAEVGVGVFLEEFAVVFAEAFAIFGPVDLGGWKADHTAFEDGIPGGYYGHVRRG